MKWREEGVVMEERRTKYGSPQSYWILTSSGRLKLCNRKFLKEFVMEESDPEVLRSQAVRFLSQHIAKAIKVAIAVSRQ